MKLQIVLISMFLGFSINAEESKYATRVSVLASYGPSGDVNCRVVSNRWRCESSDNVAVGLQVMRDVTFDNGNLIHGLIQVQTNEQVTVGFGVGF